MKTVAHCATPFLPANGSWLYHQIAHLRRYRPVVLTQEARNLDEFPVETLYTAEAYPRGRRLVNRAWRKFAGTYPYYAGILRREGASLIHAHFGHQGCRCLRAQQATGLPMVTTFYGYDATRDPRQPPWQQWYRRLFDRGALFLAEGTTLGKRLVEAGCPPEKIRVHHLGVDVARIPFRPRSPAAQVRFLICAPFREKKGIPYALQALGRVLQERDFPCEVVLIGDGPQREQILAMIDQVGLSDRVEWRGIQPYSAVLEELARCHILLQPSVTAADGDTEGGAPVILLDAQASGMPVIATEHADIPEYVREGESGLLAPERDVEALAECIRQLVEAPERWAAMGQAGRCHVEENYNAAVQTAGLEDVYDKLSL